MTLLDRTLASTVASGYKDFSCSFLSVLTYMPLTMSFYTLRLFLFLSSFYQLVGGFISFRL